MKRLFLRAIPVALVFILLSSSSIAQRRYRVVAVMKNGDKLSGELKSSTRDSLRILKADRIISVSVTDISSVRIRPKGSAGRGVGIGAGIGFVIGAIIAYSAYTPVDCNTFCIDPGPEFEGAAGGVLGGVVGGLLGLAVGSNNKEIKIEGNASQMDTFNNEFTPK